MKNKYEIAGLIILIVVLVTTYIYLNNDTEVQSDEMLEQEIEYMMQQGEMYIDVTVKGKSIEIVIDPELCCGGTEKIKWITESIVERLHQNKKGSITVQVYDLEGNLLSKGQWSYFYNEPSIEMYVMDA